MHRQRLLATVTVVAALLALQSGSGAVTPAQSAPAPVLPAASPAFVPSARARTGNLKITITGLPRKAKAKVVVNGAGRQLKVTRSKTLKNLKVFVYDINVSDLKYGKYWYRGVRQTTTKAVYKGKTAKLKIRYTRATSPTPAPVPSTSGPRFNLSNTVAVGIKGTSTTAGYAGAHLASTDGSNLVAVRSDNTTSSALTAGSLNVSVAQVGPDGYLYLALAIPVHLETGTGDIASSCALVRVKPGNQRAECVDLAISNVLAVQLTDQGLGIGNPTMQFDSAGAVYYLGLPKAGTGQYAIFRNAGGVVTNLTPAGVLPTDFLVAPDGNIFVSGATNGSQWLRRISPEGRVTNLATHSTNFLRAFSDGNVYFSGSGYGDIGRYLSAAGALDSSDWLGPCFNPPQNSPHYSCEALLDATGQRNEFLQVNAASPMSLVTLDNGQAIGPLRNFDPSHTEASRGWIVRYLPEPSFLRSSIQAPTMAVAGGNELVVAGTTSSGGQRLIAFDSTTDTERTLLDGEVRIAQLAYSVATGSVRFAGTRLVGGATVIGSVDLGSGAVEIKTSNDKLTDLQGL